MDYINYLINVIERSIPREVLDIALSIDSKFSLKNTTLESKIEHQVLRKTVLLDMNLISGLEMVLPINDMMYINDTDGATLLKISDRALQGRSIISALSLANANETKDIGASDASEGFSQVMQNNNDWSSANIVVKMEVISPNEILVYENIQNIMGSSLRVNVEYSNRFNEINPKSYPKLAEISILAVEAHIYKNMIIKINQGQLYHGHSIDSISNIIEQYSESLKEYYENLPLIRKILFINDAISMDRFIKNMIPNNN